MERWKQYVWIPAGVLLVLFFVGTAVMGMPKKHSRRGYLGVSVEKLSREDQKELGVSHGVWVVGVDEDGPAEKAGIQEDDIIQSFDGKKIRRTDDLVRLVRQTEPGSEAKVGLFREGKNEEVTVEVGKTRFRVWSDWDDDGCITVVKGGGYLGVQIQALNEDLAGYFGTQADGGALILEVEEDSPAEKTGLKAGDVIVQMDEKKVNHPDDVREMLVDLEEGDEVEITTLRHGRTQRFKVTLDERSYGSTIRVFKHFRKRDWDRHSGFFLNLPWIHEFEVPEYHSSFDRDLERKLEQKLDGIQEKIEKQVEKGLRVVEELDCI